VIFHQKLQFTYPYASVQPTEAFSPQKRTFSTSKHINSEPFLFLWVIFALLDPDPGSKSGLGSTDLIESGSNPDPDPKHRLKTTVTTNKITKFTNIEARLLSTIHNKHERGRVWAPSKIQNGGMGHSPKVEQCIQEQRRGVGKVGSYGSDYIYKPYPRVGPQLRA
jgi:hypothetical protein